MKNFASFSKGFLILSFSGLHACLNWLACQGHLGIERKNRTFNDRGNRRRGYNYRTFYRAVSLSSAFIARTYYTF